MGDIADKIKIAQDKDGMLRRALERIIQLYTDKSHFVYELLQNAEDAEARSIRFVQYSDRLEVFHDGRPFTSANLEGLCDIGKSDKIDNLNQIGEFGVGFKSVFGICERVRLYSEPSHFRAPHESDAVPFAIEILDFTRPEDIPEEPLPREYTTRFVFPYTVGQSFSGFETLKKLKETLSYKLQNLGITTLLFMKNLELIEYQIETGDEAVKGEYLLEKTPVNDHCLRVSALGTKKRQEKDGEADEMISYLKFSRSLDKFPQRTVDIAFPIKIEEDDTYQCVKATSPYVSVYFPTETESKLNFIVQGPYRTTPNRSNIPTDDEDNKYLAQETAILLRQSVLELKEAGKFNMSFVKALPLSGEQYDFLRSSLMSNVNELFLPLYDTIRELFRTAAILPSKSGKYVFAKYSKISRQERLAAVFSDIMLTALINDGHDYYWLPTFLTETNEEYAAVYKFLTRVLNISVIRPEDLRLYIAANPKFLPEQSDDWLVELYGIFENIPAAFSKSRNETNMTTADIIKTSTGIFVAPFRREGKTYIPNVFLPSSKIHSEDIHFVNQILYEKCRHFFDDIIQLQKPNEYEFLIKDIERRYGNGYLPSDEQHIEDIKTLLKYVRNEDYQEEVSHIIRDVLTIRCTDGTMRNPSSSRIFVPITTEGLYIEAYHRNITQNVFFVDLDFYDLHDIDEQKLVLLGVQNTLLIGQDITSGTYDTGSRGKAPQWWTTGDFRWRLSCKNLKEVLRYISAHPTAKDTILKSQTIMKILVNNESRLHGRVMISGNAVPNLENESCELIKILRGERMMGWDGKWIFTVSKELAAPKHISKHDINTDIYGKIKLDSILFTLLGFKKTEADELDDLKKTIPQEKLDALVESEIKRRYGISSADLDARYGGVDYNEESDEETSLPFPKYNVRSWDALKKHAAEMLIYADPVRYEDRVRSIRVSNRPREARAYLQNMYRHEGANRFKFSCQLCHEVCSSIEVTGIFLKPETELDPMNLCLCPNCAAEYRKLRANSDTSEKLSKQITAKRDEEIQEEDYVPILLDEGRELWFTQTHFAEIRELVQLTEEVKKNNTSVAEVSKDDEGEKSGLSVYSGYVGKVLRRKDGFVGVVKEVTDTYLIVDIKAGEKAGTETKIQLSFVIKNRGVYTISDQ